MMSLQGFFSLSRKTSYYHTSRNLEFTRCRFRDVRSHCNLTGASTAVLRGVCQVSERYGRFDTQFRGFETSRDMTIKSLTAKWIEASSLLSTILNHLWGFQPMGLDTTYEIYSRINKACIHISWNNRTKMTTQIYESNHHHLRCSCVLKQ